MSGKTGSSAFFDLAGQKRRREQLQAWCREEIGPRYDKERRWIAPEKSGDTCRERESHGYAFYAGDKHDIALANTILEAIPDDLNDFSGCHAAKLLGLYEDKMSKAVREKLLKSLEVVTEHSYRHIFRYTENCGLLNTIGLLEANRRFNRPHYLDRTRRFLEVFCRFLENGNVCKEYLSVNYHIVSITGAAYLRQLSPDAHCGDLAGRIESILWDELVLLWHPKLFLSGAASGRSYTPNSIPVASGLNLSAWIAYGEAATPSPKALGLLSKPGTPEAHASGCPAHDLPFWQACISWSSAPEYHPTEEQKKQTVDKTFPCEMKAKTEAGAFREHEVLFTVSKEECQKLGGWWGGGAGDKGEAHIPSTILRPGGEVLLASHMTPDWGLGTATRQMLGSSNACFASWRRAPKVERLADTRTLFMRYVINDKLEKAFTEQEQGNIEDEGRGGAAQSGPLGIAWYAGDEKENSNIARLRTCVIFSLWHGNDFDELWIGDKSLPSLAGVSASPEWVFIRDGDTYIGLRPLLLTDHGAARTVEVKKVGAFRVATFANYDGHPRDFLTAALRQTGGGTLVCMGSKAEYPAGFAAFRGSCATVRVEDELYQSQRHLKATWGGREVELLWDMQTGTLLWLRTEKGYLRP